MSIAQNSICLETMLDILCYEMIRGSLSPEMEILLSEHLESCAACRRRVYDFLGRVGISAQPEVSRMVH